MFMPSDTIRICVTILHILIDMAHLVKYPQLFQLNTLGSLGHDAQYRSMLLSFPVRLFVFSWVFVPSRLCYYQGIRLGDALEPIAHRHLVSVQVSIGKVEDCTYPR